jgi:hypothetical protein
MKLMLVRRMVINKQLLIVCVYATLGYVVGDIDAAFDLRSQICLQTRFDHP